MKYSSRLKKDCSAVEKRKTTIFRVYCLKHVQCRPHARCQSSSRHWDCDNSRIRLEKHKIPVNYKTNWKQLQKCKKWMLIISARASCTHRPPRNENSVILLDRDPAHTGDGRFSFKKCEVVSEDSNLEHLLSRQGTSSVLHGTHELSFRQWRGRFRSWLGRCEM